MTPAGLDWAFFSDSGSTSVEVALKMALGFHRNTGFPRSRIVVMEHGYHGDTIGTTSVGARGVARINWMFSTEQARLKLGQSLSKAHRQRVIIPVQSH